MKSLLSVISAGFLFLGGILLLCFGLIWRSDFIVIVGGLLTLVMGVLLAIPIFREIYPTDDKAKTEGDDHKDV